MRPKREDLAFAPDIVYVEELTTGDWVRSFRSARDLINRQLGRIDRLRWRCRANGGMGDLDEADLRANTEVLLEALLAVEEQLGSAETIAKNLLEELNRDRQ